ncbi:MAG: glycosyltransferase family 9 protein [archaeon]|jgi:ADP-heptose:LPS heptosyltransferase
MVENELSRQGLLKYVAIKAIRPFARTTTKLMWNQKIEFNKKSVKRILFIQLYGIGDYLMSTPAIVSISKEFPNADKIVLCKKADKEIAELTPTISKVFTPEELQNEKFDLVVSLNDSAEASIIAWNLKPIYAIGFLKGNKVNANFDIVPQTALETKSWTENYLLIPKALGIKEPKNKDYLIKLKKSKKIDLIIKKNKLNKFIVFDPNTRKGTEAKAWGNHNYAELAKKLLEANYPLVFCGGKDETNSTETISLLSKLIQNKKSKASKILNLTGETTLSEAAYLFSKAALFVGNDSGLMHLSLAVNCPTIGIFGPTDSKILFSKKKNTFALQVRNTEWPCYTRGTFDIKPRQKEMDKIKPTLIFSKALHLLGKNPKLVIK